ncbi:hypothetical protein [Brachyspira pilosicoli]|uniref:Lipocalin-like domain-containing protein n=1 Tax=Brachyspira pilosicoli (strain ATCC BAA-1826 / 95/1000) TaxID=759914 RepID=D8IE50_BRAP9|nr:hypothetical protein [Brachyspira pilosicoli]ADK31423.1 hypothetical protein BP951000_1439 [Brachyspira pilosicoli 95/1000]
MNKKLLSLISVLFLISVLAVSCSSKDKTGSDSSTSKGLAHYAGTWILKETTTGSGGGTMVIAEDGSVNLKELNLNSTNVTDRGNETYSIVFTNTDGTVTLILKFTSDTTGSYDAPEPDGTPHSGTLTKQ